MNTEVRGRRSEVGGQRSEIRACPPSVWRGRRSDGEKVRRKKDEHRTSNVQRPTSNEKQKKRKSEQGLMIVDTRRKRLRCALKR